MRSNTFRLLGLALVVVLGLPGGALRAQDKQKVRPRKAPEQQQPTQQPAPTGAQVKERLEPDDTSAPPRADVSADALANRQQGMTEEEAQIVPYYNNYLSSYRLGPEDVISVSVFGLDRYSKAGITVPPDGVIALALIPDGIFVVGKTTQQVAAEITKRYDEYVIDPKVTVTLEKAQSAIFSVVGNVMQPGIRTMTRRLSVSEAVSLAGGATSTANLSKVIVARRGADGYVQPIPVNLAAIAKGRAPDTLFLNPGDQVIVPGDKWKKAWQTVISTLPIISFARIFTGGF
jgi:polysaccharide export outer membrane protein